MITVTVTVTVAIAVTIAVTITVKVAAKISHTYDLQIKDVPGIVETYLRLSSLRGWLASSSLA